MMQIPEDVDDNLGLLIKLASFLGGDIAGKTDLLKRLASPGPAHNIREQPFPAKTSKQTFSDFIMTADKTDIILFLPI